MDIRVKPSKLQFYDNRKERLSAKEVRLKTGADYVMNCIAFDFDTFQPVMGFRMDGKTVVLDDDYLGITWNTAEDVTMARASAGKQNYMTYIPMVQNGAKMKLYLSGDQLNAKTRPIFGVFDNGDVWIHVDKTARKPEAFQELAISKGVVHCVGLDGGGSTCGSSAEEEVTTTRAIPIFLCIWEEKEPPKETPREEENTMYKIALGAGHGINTAGKRCMKALDSKETREWWLNDRVCDYIAEGLKDYEGYSLLRMDDSDDGKDNIELSVRAKTANTWGADVYISVHHNAGANGTTAGGIVAFSHPQAGSATHALRDELYNALIKHTGLKGNRYDGTLTYNYQILRETNMPAVLLELGFMDSKIDVPIILTDAHARKCAAAIVEVLVKHGKLTKKKVASTKTYTVNVTKTVDVYSAPAVSKIETKGVYTIVEEKNGYGKLKSGIGWIKLAEVKKV